MSRDVQVVASRFVIRKITKRAKELRIAFELDETDDESCTFTVDDASAEADALRFCIDALGAEIL